MIFTAIATALLFLLVLYLWSAFSRSQRAVYDGIEKAVLLLADKIDALQERVEDLEELETRIEELEDDDEEDADLAQWKREEALRRKMKS